MTARILLIFVLTFTAFLSANERPAKPNVVLILVDDLGWQDVGCYDLDKPCPFDTPHLDRLAKKGIQFWQGYSPAPTCAPTRCAILSGKHPARLQKTHVVGGNPPTPHSKNSPLIEPWYSGRMKTAEVTIAEALQSNGYTTGCVGKWHCAINHHAFPQPKDQGFTVSHMNLGATRSMSPDRLSNFATTDEDDPYRLDENGIPFHQNSEDAINFVKDHKSDPFFLYYATWLVHTPIHSRSKALLEKYCEKMGVPYPTDPKGWNEPGQNNPYYGAMVEMLDDYVGQLVTYLEETEDPRWAGHKLIENTYIIFTSDNGGMEGKPGEIITDNYPLDKGKINAKEGGVRVPLMITGPGIEAGQQSDAMINGLDFYPTILAWTGTEKPAEQQLDGLDISEFVKSDNLTNSALGRDTMFWHFPNSAAMQSTIRVGNYKLIRNWRGHLHPNQNGLELYQLYDEKGDRVDIEEANNLAIKQPELAEDLDSQLQELLDSMDASPAYWNPRHVSKIPGKEGIPTVTAESRDGNKVTVTFESNGNQVTEAHLLYTDNGGHKYEEWYRLPAKLNANGTVEA
ncbi:MAG: sulfatase, partial [Verrucomicrobiota bacterium]